MAREFMPKSSALMPYIVVNRDAAVAGVFTVDGEAGTVDLTGKYVQITNYNQRVGSLETQVTTNKGDIVNLNTAVGSINGSITSINTSLGNKAAKGANSDITSLTALSGPLRLGGDAVNAYDAVTLRQLQSSSGGSGGASLNGVMNNFLGAVEWFNGSRAKLPAGHVAADGQLLNRADYPDIWNAINSGVFVSVDDTTWLNASGSQYVHRGKYSTGNGTTTFRMPDLNGQTTGSIIPFLRGDGSGGSVGVVYESGAPNITGTSPYVLASKNTTPTGAIANNWSPYYSQAATGGNDSNAYRENPFSFDASRSSSVYGRANEIRPQSVIGIWIIRVNGSYSASNTNFNVVTGDTTAPAAGTIVYGGDVKSVYQIGGVDTATAALRSKYTVGGVKTAEIRVIDGSTTTSWTMPTSAGQLALSTDSRFNTVDGKTSGTISGSTTLSQANGSSNYPVFINRTFFSNGSYFGGGLQFGYTPGANKLDDAADMYIQYDGTIKSVFMRHIAPNGTAQANFAWHSNGNFNAYQGNFIGVSDERIKENIVRIEKPLEKMKQIKGVTYNRRDTGKFGIGFIAQDVQAVFPESVYTTGYDVTLPDGSVISDVRSPDTSNVSAALHHEAILALMEKVEALEKELAELKAK